MAIYHVVQKCIKGTKNVHIEGCLEDISLSDLLTDICKDGSTLSNCGMMTDASL